MRISFPRAALAIATALAATSAQAHPGHDGGALAGLLHPLLGIDHLLAMLALGLWAAAADQRTRRLLPAGFVAAMALAAAAALGGVALPVVETGIAGSVLLAGLLILLRVRAAPFAGALLAITFALLHGYAHGVEMPADAVAWQYFAGFLASSFALVQAGLFAGGRLARWKPALAACGTLLCASGGWMLAQLA